MAVLWAGLGLAYALPAFPPSFTLMTTAAAEYALAATTPGQHRHQRQGTEPTSITT
jgi:hypothetical protein